MGDSLDIIGWISKSTSLSVLNFEGWKPRVSILKRRFVKIDFQHIFRAFNRVADKLSKDALVLEEGIVYYEDIFHPPFAEALSCISILRRRGNFLDGALLFIS